MKANHISTLSKFALAGLTIALIFGCSKSQEPQTATFVSVQKTSFNEVTSQLDSGGNFYMYLGTAQWLENLSSKTEHWREAFISMPGVTDEQ
ncbi:MAG: hypothetical protein ACRED1_10550, partial [Limisphaerales bacterium]